MLGRERIEYKSPEQVLVMRRAGLVVAQALASVRAAVRPGVTTADLDDVAAAVIRDAGAVPSFLGYHGYPRTLCTSVGAEVVHGIPGDRALVPGDLLSVDCGAVVDGWHGDAAFSVLVGDPEDHDPADAALVETTRCAMWEGIAALARGLATRQRLGVVGDAVEGFVERTAAAGGAPLGIVDGYVGHGIGTAMHQAPEVLNHRSRARGPKLRPGLCVAVEPMLVRGEADTDVLEDGWTVVTTDGSTAAHWEHTVALGERGAWVLTAEDGGAAELAARGVEVAPLV
ncbi:methionine aminopeptidase, type I [Quadrisphaera granulorum]|uniref:Methionine aminopeptidase n=1 Tax=Quadrisphaera granulorum TaxID=317664 RepID=A0A316ACY3_9ACTN|nr:type I methionyl aminopeptidase [Quadrisphaera granulorum]PWJ55452.1 methionine aminopeptidase type I [Quadrisphaera granulorum]SZE95516.1 methionine aminopeptidase, type I [Quadrisphaera granulorum]